eukprot:m.65959 g.65959  ORF g.65959 m.65959 type:complete len:175 (+) comp7600_c0_seq2:3845-4369(+)
MPAPRKAPRKQSRYPLRSRQQQTAPKNAPDAAPKTSRAHRRKAPAAPAPATPEDAPRPPCPPPVSDPIITISSPPTGKRVYKTVIASASPPPRARSVRRRPNAHAAKARLPPKKRSGRKQGASPPQPIRRSLDAPWSPGSTPYRDLKFESGEAPTHMMTRTLREKSQVLRSLEL